MKLNAILENYISYVWIDSGALAASSSDDVVEAAMSDWFIETVKKFGNPFSESFMGQVFHILDTIPHLSDVDDPQTLVEMVLSATLDNDMDKSLHDMDREFG